MYAVIRAGSRQFKVAEGDTLQIDRIAGKEGDTISLDQVLMVGGKSTVLGSPLVSGAVVQATIESHSKGPKIRIFKYKRKKNYKVTQGHRQPITTLKSVRSRSKERIEMAHKKAGGSTKNGRDSNPQYRGIKVWGGQQVTAGSIIVRQVGETFKPGLNVGRGRDFTLFALANGVVNFERVGKRGKRVSITPVA